MRLAIDAHAIGERLTGNETYISNLIEQIIKLDQGHELVLFFTTEEGEARWRYRHQCVRTVLIRPANPLIRIPLVMPLLAASMKADVLHVQYAGPWFSTVPVVTTIHDISFEHYPELFTKKELIQFKATIPLTAHRSARVLTVSEFCKRDIVDIYGLPEEKVVVTYDGVDERFKPSRNPGSEIQLKQKYGIEGKYILTVGNLQPRKNMVRLIDAYSRLREARPDISQKLVIVGKKAWKYNPILASVGNSKWSDDVILTDYVPDDELPLLYSCADVLVYPSLFEGFGLPPLEAMACGTPTIVSDRSAIPEVVGKAGIKVNPYDTGEIAAAIASVLLDDDIAQWYHNAGINRAAKFTWSDCAERTMQVYEEVSRSRN